MAATLTRLPRVQEIELNLVCSGHKRAEAQARKALAEAGLSVIARDDKRHRQDDWALPSYTDPLEAHKAGKPNAGHTPGTGHPSVLTHLRFGPGHVHDADCDGQDHHEVRPHVCQHVGSPYARDDRIAFVGCTVRCAREAQGDLAGKAHRAVAAIGWALRMHWEAGPEPPKLTAKQKLERLGLTAADLRDILALEG